MKLIKYSLHTGKENMQIDSDLLENAILNKSSEPVFRLYGWSPKCVSLGRNQSQISTASGIDIVRRITGGRALLHDNEVTYSYISPISVIPDGESVIQSYKYISGFLINFFKTLNIELDFGGEKKGASSHDYCMLISTGADVCYKGRKIIGSAQCRKQGYLLQHGSILFDYDKELLENLFNENVSANSICTINEILPDLSREDFVKKFEEFITNEL